MVLTATFVTLPQRSFKTNCCGAVRSNVQYCFLLILVVAVTTRTICVANTTFGGIAVALNVTIITTKNERDDQKKGVNYIRECTLLTSILPCRAELLFEPSPLSRDPEPLPPPPPSSLTPAGQVSAK